MNVGSLSASGGQFVSLQSDGVGFDECTTISGKLAVLMLETQEQQKHAQQEELTIARRDFTEALSHEVQALRDQADASFRGAVFAGSAAIVSGGLGAWGATLKCAHPWQTPTGEAFGKLSQPLGAAVGKTYGAADAKSAQGAQEAAKWQIDDARDAIRDAKGLEDKALDWASSMSERDAATISAILSNKV